MNQSDRPTLAGYFCMFYAMSTLVAFYWVYASQQSRGAPLTPGSTLSIGWQWVMTGLGGVVSAICAVALLRRLPWGRTVLIAQFLLSNVAGLFLYKGSVVFQLFGALVSAVPLMILFRAPIVRATDNRRRSVEENIQRAVGLGFFGFATLLLYVTIGALFNGTSPTMTSVAMTSGQALMNLGAALLIMWIGGVIWQEKRSAQHVTGLLLVALASFEVLQCVMSYVYVRVQYPQARGLFHWDATLQVLLILSIVGFALLGLSRKHQRS